MKSRLLVLAFLSALGPLTSAAPCKAQNATEDASTAIARARFKEGVAFYDKGEYEQARVAFLQAYALKRHPAVLLNLAWSCLKSGHALEAERYFRQFIAEGREITPKQRADADDGLAQAQAKLGRIEIVAPEGTEVTIDGERVGRSPLPDVAAVEPGTHAIGFKGVDGASESRNVSVVGGERVVARFPTTPGQPAPAAPAAATASSPTSTLAANPGPQPAPVAPATGGVSVVETEPPNETAPSAASHYGHPSVAILVAGGVVTLASAGVALGMFVAKSSALDKANTLGNEIVAYSRAHNIDPKNCTAAAPSVLAQPCQTWNSDNKDANTDAVLGNIALGVSGVAAAATIIYWIVAANQRTSNAARLPVLSPMLGRSMGGLSLTAAF